MLADFIQIEPKILKRNVKISPMQGPKFSFERLPSTAYWLNRFSTFFHASGFFPPVALSRNFKLLIRPSFSFGRVESPWDLPDDDIRFRLVGGGGPGEFMSTNVDIVSGLEQGRSSPEDGRCRPIFRPTGTFSSTTLGGYLEMDLSGERLLLWLSAILPKRHKVNELLKKKKKRLLHWCPVR